MLINATFDKISDKIFVFSIDNVNRYMSIVLYFFQYKKLKVFHFILEYYIVFCKKNKISYYT